MNKESVKAPGFRVLVRLKQLESELKTAGGLIIALKTGTKEQEAVCKAYVIDVGPEAWWDVGSGKAWCKPGDCVQIARYSGVILSDDLRDDDKDVYRIINDRDILAIFPEERIEL